MDKKYNTSYDAVIDYSTQTQVSPLISKFNVKILYLGGNRNGTYLTKETVDDMVSTIGGVPVVGHYDATKQDFLGHGDLRVEFDEDGNVITKNIGPVPYGYIPEKPRIWWEKQVDKDEVEREYLCTEAYLWTGRYPELNTLKDNQNNQSMELNPNSVTGEWADVDGDCYYVIKKADFLGLCILGKDVEPCFEGANFNFSLDDSFVTVLSTMKNELKDALANFELSNNNNNDNDDEFKDNDLDNLEGPTVEELKALEAELAQARKDYSKIKLEYNALLQSKEQLEKELEEAHKSIETYQKTQQKTEKLNLMSEYKEDLSEEEYNNFINNIDNYTIDKLELEAKTLAYNNVKKLMQNKNIYFTLADRDMQGNEGFLAKDTWQQEVANRVRNGGK